MAKKDTNWGLILGIGAAAVAGYMLISSGKAKDALENIGISVPSMPQFNLPSMPQFSMPSMPQFSLPQMPQITMPQFDFGALPQLDFSGLPGIGGITPESKTQPAHGEVEERATDAGDTYRQMNIYPDVIATPDRAYAVSSITFPFVSVSEQLLSGILTGMPPVGLIYNWIKHGSPFFKVDELPVAQEAPISGEEHIYPALPPVNESPAYQPSLQTQSELPGNEGLRELYPWLSDCPSSERKLQYALDQGYELPDFRKPVEAAPAPEEPAYSTPLYRDPGDREPHRMI